MRLKNINIYASNYRTPEETKLATGLIRNESAHISEMFERLMRYYDNENCRKLNLVCDETADRIMLEDYGNGFPIVHMPFRFKEYCALRLDIQKSCFWLDLICGAIAYVSSIWNWDMGFFDLIRERVIASGFKNIWRYGKYAPSPLGLKNAAIRVEQDIHSTKVYLVILKGRAEQKRFLIQETEPPFYKYTDWLGEIHWTDEERLEVTTARGRTRMIFSHSFEIKNRLQGRTEDTTMTVDHILIRPVSTADAEALLAIYAPYVEETAVTFECQVPSIEEFTSRIRNVLVRYPYLVAVDGDEIVGYAYASTFKNRAAYDWAVEVSIYVKKGHHGKGIGRLLYTVLEEILRQQNIVNLYACIASTKMEDEYLTRDSIHFHEHMGYQIIGEFRQCGFKCNRWYDMVWMEKIIGTHQPDQVGVIPFSQLKENKRF